MIFLPFTASTRIIRNATAAKTMEGCHDSMVGLLDCAISQLPGSIDLQRDENKGHVFECLRAALWDCNRFYHLRVNSPFRKNNSLLLDFYFCY